MRDNAGVRQWTVAGALLERDNALLLVQNRRPTGTIDWSPPGGVIDRDDDSVHAGLAREVHEETGLVVSTWGGLCYEVQASAPELGWEMRCEVHYASHFDGAMAIADPDGIVTEAVFVAHDACATYLESAMRWVREPLQSWLTERWEPGAPRIFTYEVRGDSPATFTVERTDQ